MWCFNTTPHNTIQAEDLHLHLNLLSDANADDITTRISSSTALAAASLQGYDQEHEELRWIWRWRIRLQLRFEVSSEVDSATNWPCILFYSFFLFSVFFFPILFMYLSILHFLFCHFEPLCFACSSAFTLLFVLFRCMYEVFCAVFVLITPLSLFQYPVFDSLWGNCEKFCWMCGLENVWFGDPQNLLMMILVWNFRF